MSASPFAAGGPRLVAVDLDGTLLTSDHRVSARSRAAVARLERQGVAVVLCTGRPPRSAKGYAAELGLTRPFICYHGAARFDPRDDRASVRHTLDPEVARRALLRLRRAFPGLMAGVETAHGWYLEPAMLERRVREARLGTEEPTAVGPAERFLSADAIKLFVRAEAETGPVPAATMAEAVAGLPLTRTWSAGPLLELLNPRVDKRAALAEMCRSLGIDRRAVAAFGDQRNDVAMLRWAHLGVAMANASREAKRAADVVTLSNDDDGVAVVLEGWTGEPALDPAHQAPTGG